MLTNVVLFIVKKKKKGEMAFFKHQFQFSGISVNTLVPVGDNAKEITKNLPWQF